MSWKNVPLRNICEINMGAAPKGTSYVDLEQGTPLIAGAADYGEIYPQAKKSTNKPTKVCQPEDIIMCVRATIGNLNWANKEYCLGRGVAGLRASKDHLDSKYLWYFIKSYERELHRNSTGSTFPQINKKVIESIPIPLPPLKTQQHIATILEKADQLRKDCQQMEQELNQLAQSVFIEMFGDPVRNPKEWEIGIIGDLVDSVNYGTSSKASEEKLQYPVLRMNNITYEGRWDFSSLKYMNLTENEQKKYLVKNSDLLFNRTNSRDLVGKTAVFYEDKPMAFAGYLVRARCNNKATPEYISAFMNSKYSKQTLKAMCKSIVGMANINAKEFQKIKIPLAPISIQLEFSQFIQKNNMLLKKLQEELVTYDNLFNALSQKAFKGELTET